MKEQFEQDRILMSPHYLTNFEIQTFYQNELAVKQAQQKFNFYSRNRSPNSKLKHLSKTSNKS